MSKGQDDVNETIALIIEDKRVQRALVVHTVDESFINLDYAIVSALNLYTPRLRAALKALALEKS
jgi:hypothetical protein